jgi:hypothetical protein
MHISDKPFVDRLDLEMEQLNISAVSPSNSKTKPKKLSKAAEEAALFEDIDSMLNSSAEENVKTKNTAKTAAKAGSNPVGRGGRGGRGRGGRKGAARSRAEKTDDSMAEPSEKKRPTR